MTRGQIPITKAQIASICSRAESTSGQPKPGGSQACSGSKIARSNRPVFSAPYVNQPSRSSPRGCSRESGGNIQSATPQISCVTQPTINRW